jgi:pSer/pThr/pTyr-binding forkhead associated (FHA) protein
MDLESTNGTFINVSYQRHIFILYPCLTISLQFFYMLVYITPVPILPGLKLLFSLLYSFGAE